MERLTDKAWRNFDPWECCGQDKYCQRGCHDPGGCTKGCIVPRLYARLGAYEDTELTPEEINDLASAREISPEAEYAINKHADSIIERLDKLLTQTDDDARLRELAEADRAGRLVVLPFTSGRTLLCKENIDSPRLMKDVELAIRYCSSCGIVFHMGYNLFCDLVKHGRITAVSEEAEKALEAMKK